VDKSGRWGYGGVFSAINEVDRLVGHVKKKNKNFKNIYLYIYISPLYK